MLTASGLKALVLPAITLGLFQMTLIMRLVRGEMLEVLRTDYIKFARARGLTDRAVNFGHALKNTLVPVMTIAGLQLGSIIAFALITESVFQWPGMGLLFLKAVQNVDIPIMSAYLLLVAFIFVTINLIVDMLYAVVDPRIRIDARGGLHDGRSRNSACGPDAPPVAAARDHRQRPRLFVPALARHHRGGRGDAGDRARRRCSRPGSRRTTLTTCASSACSTRTTRRPGCSGGDRRFLLGTDDQGRDVFSTILYGSRQSISDRRDGDAVRRPASASRSG